MNEADLAKGEAVRNVYKEAAEMKAEGVPAEIIKDVMQKKLTEKGLPQAAAVMICDNLPGVKPERDDYPHAGKKNMIIGGVLFCCGVLVTWISEAMAIKRGGAYYVIAIGPMLTGLGIFVKGFFDYKADW
ncbi:MAG: hypothetical protein ABIG64_06955 [Candidatus Omnitrophota bacterium]